MNANGAVADSLSFALGALGQSDLGPSPTRVGLALGLVVVLVIVAGALWFRRGHGRSGATRDGDIRVVSRAVVGRRAAVMLLEVDGRRVLVGSTPTTLTSLSEWESEPEPEPVFEAAELGQPEEATRFDVLLGRVINRLKALEGSVS